MTLVNKVYIKIVVVMIVAIMIILLRIIKVKAIRTTLMVFVVVDVVGLL